MVRTNDRDVGEGVIRGGAAAGAGAWPATKAVHGRTGPRLHMEREVDLARGVGLMRLAVCRPERSDEPQGFAASSTDGELAGEAGSPSYQQALWGPC